MNCWQFKKCGREPFGEKAKELGVCPASVEKRTDDVNGGKNGGRCCRALAGTLCGGKVQGSFVSKAGNCMQCDFFKLVGQEEGQELKKPTEILALIRA